MAFYDLNMNNKKVSNAQDPTSAQDLATKNYIDNILQGYMKQVKVERFTTSGTFTPPAGSSYAIAHIRAGGGGCGDNGTPAGAGGDSSVAFASGTITAVGGLPWATGTSLDFPLYARAGVANSGEGAQMSSGRSDNAFNNKAGSGGNGAYIVAGGAITPSVGISVIVGNGGTAGVNGAVGGSGYVWIEYY